MESVIICALNQTSLGWTNLGKYMWHIFDG